MRKFGIKLVAKLLGAIAISFLGSHHTYINTPSTPSTGTFAFEKAKRENKPVLVSGIA